MSSNNYNVINGDTFKCDLRLNDIGCETTEVEWSPVGGMKAVKSKWTRTCLGFGGFKPYYYRCVHSHCVEAKGLFTLTLLLPPSPLPHSKVFKLP